MTDTKLTRGEFFEKLPEEKKQHFLEFEKAKDKIEELQDHCKKFVDENEATIFLVVVDEKTGYSDMQVSTKYIPENLLANRRIDCVVNETLLRAKNITKAFNQ